jgi:hypothetical protein
MAARFTPNWSWTFGGKPMGGRGVYLVAFKRMANKYRRFRRQYAIADSIIKKKNTEKSVLASSILDLTFIDKPTGIRKAMKCTTYSGIQVF